MTATITKVGTWLPVFSGFYDTLYDPGDKLDHALEQCQKAGKIPADEKYLYDYWDNGAYELAVVQRAIEAFGSWFGSESGIERIEFEALKHPKEYNFDNDHVDIQVHLDLAVFGAWIKAYLAEHAGEWEKYLRSHYTSRDGFIPFYSNRVEDWAEAIDSFISGNPVKVPGYRRYHLADGSHLLGQLLGFWAETELPDPICKLYYETTEDLWLGEFFNCEVPEDVEI